MLDILPQITAAAVPILSALCGWGAGRLKRNSKETTAMKNGLKGLLRAKVIDLGLHYIEEKEIPPYGMETLRLCYDSYIDLGDGDPAVSHIFKKCEALPVRTGRD